MRLLLLEHNALASEALLDLLTPDLTLATLGLDDGQVATWIAAATDISESHTICADSVDVGRQLPSATHSLLLACVRMCNHI